MGLNSEQQKAVEHSGGVLLKAGAGSGKTTVLIAHLVYLTANWIREFGPKEEGFEEFIRGKFSGLVMMTFTKKAAGEMSVRLNAKFETLAKAEGPLQLKWQICLSALPVLAVTTIDGFNRRLITSGYFPELSTEVSTIFEAERFEQVNVLFHSWLELNEDNIPPEIKEIIDRARDQLLTSMKDIFNSSSLRLLWKEYSIEQSSPDKLGSILEQSFYLNKLDDSLLAIHDLTIPVDKPSAFEKNVEAFQRTGLPEINSVENLKIYCNLFAGISRLAGQHANTRTPQHEAALEGLKALRKWGRDEWLPVVTKYTDHYAERIHPWLKICKALFDHIDEGLDPNHGMTFGDVEYFVARALKSPEAKNRIHKQYKYLIVDEFQDTSAIQFRIIRELIGNDFTRLFCVGDPKQAIYGFRGGEISVFQDCEKLVPMPLTLANNYRSFPDVITFNNSIFRAVLPVGRTYVGRDPFPVAAEDQYIPSEVARPTSGLIQVEEIDLLRAADSKRKLKNPELEAIEAKSIAKSIQRIRRETPDEVCTVLYRSVKRASVRLIRHLMEMKIGFTAQYKVALADDPLVGIFLVLLKRQFDRNPASKQTYPMLMLETYLSILGLKAQVRAEDLENFDKDIQYWGLLNAFRKFIFRLGISNENADLNYEEIETLCHLYYQDSEAVLSQLQENSETVNLDFRYGKNPGLVQIMTAHASKGLEFDHVFLGGIYTNGYEPPEREIFGDRPDSFKYYLDLSQKDDEWSPMLLLESELKKLKDFSESKRLFYVSCTRAKKGLYWVNIPKGPELLERFQKNSWISAIQYWESHAEGALHANLIRKTVGNPIDIDSFELSGSSTPLPLFFYDSVGVHDKSGPPAELAITGELSVTRLNSLIDCPRKFYFQNTLKLKTVEEVRQAPLFGNEDEMTVISSSERGSKVHAYISKGIAENFVVHRDIFETEMKVPVEWTLNELRGIPSDHKLISEKPLKFKFFNFMISGIPDLIVISDKEAQVWDFKTGRSSQENLSHYWVQLKSYAYALYELGRVPIDQSILLRLCFVDQKQYLDLEVSRASLLPELYQLWNSQNRPWKTNPDHCTRCEYGTICHR